MILAMIFKTEYSQKGLIKNRKKSMIRFFALEVKSKNLEKCVLEKYPLLEHIFNGINMKLEKKKLPINKKNNKKR